MLIDNYSSVDILMGIRQYIQWFLKKFSFALEIVLEKSREGNTSRLIQNT